MKVLAIAIGVAVVLVMVILVIRNRKTDAGSDLSKQTSDAAVRVQTSGLRARLVVRRGLHPEWEYFIFDGRNIIGRAEEQPVEIDVESQESPDNMWSSLQHACISCVEGKIAIQDLGSANGTYVNQHRVQAGESLPLNAGDTIQIGTVHLELVIGGGPHFDQEGAAAPQARPAAESVAKLQVTRGLQPKREYLLFSGRNIIGRGDQQPVQVDLQSQEPNNRVWSSRQHACITCQGHELFIEDLVTANGTYVNRRRVPPGERRRLRQGDVIQIGEVQLKLSSNGFYYEGQVWSGRNTLRLAFGGASALIFRAFRLVGLSFSSN